MKTLATISQIEYSPSERVSFVRCTPDTKFSFQEWQFLMIESIFDHPELGKPLKKPYSIATTNEELQISGTVWFIVKKTVDGFMSDYLTKWISVWDRIVISWPFWHMIDAAENNKYLLVATGSGVSPMVALFGELTKNDNNKVVNIYGERYHCHILPSVENLFLTNNDKVKNILFLSQDDADGYRRWHVQLGLDEAIQFLGEKNITVFICGAPVMVDDVRQMLTERWFSKEQMKFEKY